MPITFSLRSVAWLGVDPANLRNPSGSPAPRHSAPLVYEGGPTDEIQYLVHGCPQVTMVSAVKGETQGLFAIHGPFGEVFRTSPTVLSGTDGTSLTGEQWGAVEEVANAFATERAAGRLR